MNKQSQIDAWTERPIQVGDFVNVDVPYQVTQNETTGKGKSKVTVPVVKNMNKTGYGDVVDIFDHMIYGKVFAVEFNSWSMPHEADKITILGASYKYNVYLLKEEWVMRDYAQCGKNPFNSEPPRINFYSKTIDSLLHDCGYRNNFMEIETKVIGDRGHASESDLIGCTYGGVNFDPFVIDTEGTKQFIQRGLVWSTEQKQALIESIYNWIEIGKFVFRYKSWPQLTKEMLDNGHAYNWDCIDGKQRLNAIIDFVQGKFADVHGNYWSDLSTAAQNRFLNYDRLVFGKLDEGTTDAAVVRSFLTLNFTGVPMSVDHIQFVQSLKM